MGIRLGSLDRLVGAADLAYRLQPRRTHCPKRLFNITDWLQGQGGNFSDHLVDFGIDTANSFITRGDPMSRPSSVAAADQMGFTPDEARCPGLDVPRPSVVPFAAQAAVELFRDRRPVDGRGVEGREFVGGVHPVGVRRGVAARGSKDSGGSAKPDGYVAESM